MKVVVSRNLGPDVMPLLEERKDLEVCLDLPCELDSLLICRHKLVVWPEDQPCDRKWFLENIPGAHSGVQGGIVIEYKCAVATHVVASFRDVNPLVPGRGLTRSAI